MKFIIVMLREVEGFLGFGISFSGAISRCPIQSFLLPIAIGTDTKGFSLPSWLGQLVQNRYFVLLTKKNVQTQLKFAHLQLKI